jgi:hypothetical protein
MGEKDKSGDFSIQVRFFGRCFKANFLVHALFENISLQAAFSEDLDQGIKKLGLVPLF